MKNSNPNIIILLFSLISFVNVNAQLGLGTASPNSTSEFEMSSTTKGLLIPRMSTSQMQAISNPATGLEVFNTDAGTLYFYNGIDWISANNRVTKKVNAGVALQLDNIKAILPTTGNRSIQLATVSGSIGISGFSVNQYNHSATDLSLNSASMDNFTKQSINSTLTTSYQYWQSTANFQRHGSTQEIFFNDDTNKYSYRIMLIVGRGYNNNFISIERLD